MYKNEKEKSSIIKQMILSKRIIVLFFFFFLGGCSISQRISEVPYLDLNGIEAEKKSFSLAVVFAEDLKGYILSSYPALPSSSEIELEVGQCLCTFLEQAVGVAYRNVTTLEKKPQPGIFDRILYISLDYSSYMLTTPSAFDPAHRQIIPRPDRITYILSVKLQAFNGENMELFGKTEVEANSSFLRGGKEEADQEKLKDAVQRAVQQVSFNVAHLLLSGFAEPKSNSFLSLSH